MKKGVVIGCGLAAVVCVGLCVGAFALFFGGLYAATKPVVNSAEQFLSQIGQGNISDAYQSASYSLRLQVDEKFFASAVQKAGLTEYSSASWSNRRIDGLSGLAEGTVTTKSGGKKSVSVELERELTSGQWKVVKVVYDGNDLTALAIAASIPVESEQVQMITETLSAFNRAIRAGDFTSFHDAASDLWKRQTTPAQLQQAFQEFIDRKIDLDAILVRKPRLDPAEVNSLGTLFLEGEYDSRPNPVKFEMKYTRENGVWKLMGLKVNVGK